MTVSELKKSDQTTNLHKSSLAETNQEKSASWPKSTQCGFGALWPSVVAVCCCHHKSNQSYNRGLCVYDDGDLWDRQASAMATETQTMSLSSLHRVGLSTWTFLKQRAFI